MADGNIHNLTLIKGYLNMVKEGIEKDEGCKYSICLSREEGLIIYESSNFSVEEKQVATSLQVDTHFEAYANYVEERISIRDHENNEAYQLSIKLTCDKTKSTVKPLMALAAKAIQREIIYNHHQREIKKLNEKLDQRNKLYEAQTNILNCILNHKKEIVLIMDEEGKYALVNKAAKDLMEQKKLLSIDDVYDNFKIYDENHRRIERKEDPILETFKGKTIKDFKVSIEAQEGGRRSYVSINAVSYVDEKGRKLAVGIIENISDYKKIEEIKNAYGDKVLQLNTIINTISDGVCVIDAEARCIMGSTCDHNNLFPCITGYPEKNKAPGKLCHKSLANYKIYRNNGESVDIKQYLLSKIKEGKKIEKEIFTVVREGKKCFVRLKGNSIYNKEGRMIYAVISIHDITKITRQQNRIKYQNQFINSIIDALSVPVTIISYPDHVYEYANDEYVQILSRVLGKKVVRKSIIGKGVYDIIPEEYLHLAIEDVDIKNLASKTKIIFFETQGDGMKYYKTIHTPFQYNENKVHIITVGMDITSQVQLQNKIAALAKEKEDYFATISHELRSPTAVINTVVQMLLSEYYRDEFNGKTRKLVKKIEKNSYRLLRLVNNFLDITKVESGFMTLNLNNINIISYTKSIVESVKPVGDKKDIKIIFKNRCEIKSIALDIEKYERILLNLLSNAIKYTNPKGRVEVYLKEEEDHIILGVKDNGIGISHQDLNKIFNRFFMSEHSYKRPQEGTGIGLSLVKRLIELMEGHIEVQSTEGKGSEFILYFPKKILTNQPRDLCLDINHKIEKSLKEKIYIEFSGLNI